ncbi:hypothetical protein H8E88_09190 [candidate division KSB1 bacterium]|nr:hypothetical protein [candidate division KSB1 bacterium]MBL7094533.1 hypothetical protein [candidate division KSB1 bacterium]
MKTKSIIFIPIIFAFVLSIWITPNPLELKQLTLPEIGQFLGILFVIALLLERALDIFLTTWRATDSEKIGVKIKNLETKISNLKAQKKELLTRKKGLTNPDETNKIRATELTDEINDNSATLGVLNLEIHDYKAKTRKYAMWSGLFIGIIISSLGIRTLNTFVVAQSLQSLPYYQSSVFRFMDVLLTGGLIAGGSDGIHKFIDFYRNFMENSSKKVQD